MKKDNEELEFYEILKDKAKELQLEEEKAKKKIREGFINRAIVFIDVVGSTAFKKKHNDNPEIWILRVKQFSEMIAEAVIRCNGTVVKYIGDEVMASFENINDAQNLITRINELEDSLKSGTGYETQVKVAADYGLVYELKFDNHSILDPQGTPVDRCARVAKYCVPGEVLASTSFVEKTPKLNWKKVGATDLHGLGRQIIYQLEHVTISLEERIEIEKSKYDNIIEAIDDLKTENSKLRDINHQLSVQLKELGEKPNTDSDLTDDNDTEWDKILEKISELKKYINQAPGSSRYYARFIFLYESSKGDEQYNVFENKVFDELIESNLVVETNDGWFCLNSDHPRNQKVLSIVSSLENLLRKYLSENDPDPDDLFEYSLSDSEFWSTYIDFDVVY